MTQYNPVPVEQKWQEIWKDWEIYKFDHSSDAPVYSLDNPPRYTSGTLHLGHATGYSLIDFAARFRRMRGNNVFFPLCFDVNGTPTEVRVEKKYDITKLSVSRQKFIEMCSEYAEGFIEQMTEQFEMMGASMDPSIYYQTDAPYYRRITQISFLKMLDQGLAYKGTYPVNWCPRCMTALADAEVEYRDNTTRLNYIHFGIKGEEETATIATTRPELICTCQLVAVHPEDEENQHLVGETLTTPLYDKEVEVVADDKVDPEYGSGVVMICTIGDKEDLEWVMKYDLPLEKGIDEQGKMTAVSRALEGLTVQEARDKIISDLELAGLLEDQEDMQQNVSICWRCHEPIEYLQVPQWFINILDYKEDVLEKAEEINWFPEFMKVRLEDWVNSLQWDWVISRQRYFATPIPVWECLECGEVVPAREEDCYIDPTVDPPPVEECPSCGGELKGCEDVFDTWMDSSISPLFNTYWERDEEKFEKMYPMSLRPQSHDIIRTWAFYTILREHLLVGEKPWEDIMIHGFIMAPDGTPMHSSLGNVIDPIPIMEEYGADALRYYASTCSLGEDNAFREKDVKHGKKLCNKLWNIGRFVGSIVGEEKEPREFRLPDVWILSKFTRVLNEVTEHYESYQFDKAVKAAENFAWHEFADHYIEMIKYRTKREDPALEFTLYTVCNGIMKMFAPVLPHVTEEVFSTFLKDIDGAKSIHISEWPEPVLVEEKEEERGELAKEVIAAVRSWKSDKGIPLNEELERVELIGEKAEFLLGVEEDILKTVRAKKLQISAEAELEERVVNIKPLLSKLGPEYRNAAKEIVEKVNQFDVQEVAPAIKSGNLEVELSSGEIAELSEKYFEMEKELILKGKRVETVQVGELLVAIES